MPKDKKHRSTINYRLTLVDDDTHDQLWSRKFTKMNLVITIVTTLVVTLVLFWCLVALTPVKTLIPGFPDDRTKHDAIQSAIRIDSLENIITKWELYSENLRRVVDGEPQRDECHDNHHTESDARYKSSPDGEKQTDADDEFRCRQQDGSREGHEIGHQLAQVKSPEVVVDLVLCTQRVYRLDES